LLQDAAKVKEEKKMKIPNTLAEAREAMTEHWQPRMRKCGECGTWHFARVSMSRFKTVVFCSDNCEKEYEKESQQFCESCEEGMPHFQVGSEEDHRYECDSCGGQMYCLPKIKSFRK
jgi:hypothetical protein